MNLSDGFLKIVPLLNTLTIIGGVIVGLLQLKVVLDSFKAELKSLREDVKGLQEVDEGIDHRLTIVETKCELRHGHE